MNPSVGRRRTSGSALRWVATLVLLAGLFAMHGLPMAGAARTSAMSMSAAMTTSLAPTAVGVPGPSASAVMAGCDGADHCTATLRTDDPTAIPALLGTSALHVAEIPLHHGVTGALAARGPPPNLQELGISRT